MTDKPRLHFTRLRAPGAMLMFDPQTDLRILLPAVGELVFDALDDMFKGADDEVMKGIKHLHDCFRIFQIRMMEDRMPMASQVEEFFKAIVSVPPQVLNLWYGMLTRALMCICGLFMRRDAAADSQALQAMLETTKLSLYEGLLSPEAFSKLKSELSSSVSLLVQNKTHPGDVAVCRETGEVIEHVKDIASRFMGADARSWDTLAKLCDEQFGNGGHTRNEQIALALAYPTYGIQNPLTVTVEKEVDEPEAETGAAQG